MLGAGFIALTGDLPGTIEYIKSYGALLTVPCKALIAFPLVYHYAAGVFSFLSALLLVGTSILELLLCTCPIRCNWNLLHLQ